MGHLTLADFRDHLNISLKEHRQSANQRLNVWVNTAYFSVVGDSEFEGAQMVATAETVVGQAAYSLPEDLFSIISVADLTNKYRLVNIGLRNYHLKDREVQGRPRLYTRRKRIMYLWPTPDAVLPLEVYYTEEVCPLELQDDVTVLPQSFDQLILSRARQYAWEALGDPETAAIYMQLTDRNMAKVKRDVEQSPMVTEGVNVARSFEDLTDMGTEVPD